MILDEICVYDEIMARVLLEAGGGEREERDFDGGDGVVQSLGTREQGGSSGDHIVDDEHMLALELCSGLACGQIQALGALHALELVFFGLRGMCLPCLEPKFDWGAGDIGNALCYVLTLIVAALGEFGDVQRHGDDHIDAVPQTRRLHECGGLTGKPAPQLRLVAVLEVVQQAGIGAALLVVEIGGSALDGHFACKELLHEIKIDFVEMGDGQLHVALAAHEALVAVERFAAHGAVAWHDDAGGILQKSLNRNHCRH